MPKMAAICVAKLPIPSFSQADFSVEISFFSAKAKLIVAVVALVVADAFVEAAPVPLACSIDNPDCEACQ